MSRRSEWLVAAALTAAVAAGCGGASPRTEHGAGHENEHHHGRLKEMPHRFEHAEEWVARFEDPARDAWQKPDAVLARMQLARDSVVADIGAATGYFPVRIARHVPAGRVWGID